MTRMPKPMVQAIVCGNCVHYYQHYILGERQRPIALWYGHCALPRRRDCRPDETCEHWEENHSEE